MKLLKGWLTFLAFTAAVIALDGFILFVVLRAF